MPGEVLLRVIEVTAVEPMWLLHGTGPKFRTGDSGVDYQEPLKADVKWLIEAAISLARRGLSEMPPALPEKPHKRDPKQAVE